MDDCIFCKIVRGESPCYKIYEDNEFIAFLDVFPSIEGQTLVIPKKHFSGSVFDLDEKVYHDLMKVAKKVANLLDKSLNPIKVGMTVEGLELDHVHVKLYPLKKEFGLELMEPRPSEKDFERLHDKLKN